MYTKIQVVFDAAEPGKLAEFWALALDYVFEPPPEGHATWEDFGRSIGMPEEEFGDQASVIDPADEGPRLYFQRVPEGKVAKNRVHLDVRVAGHEIRGEERKRLVSEKVEQLVQAGASLAWEADDVRGSAIVLRDPEGNEFCVALPAGRGILRKRPVSGAPCARRVEAGGTLRAEVPTGAPFVAEPLRRRPHRADARRQPTLIAGSCYGPFAAVSGCQHLSITSLEHHCGRRDVTTYWLSPTQCQIVPHRDRRVGSDLGRDEN